MEFINYAIYANLFKINVKWLLLSFLGRFWLFVLSDRAWCGLQNFYTEFWNSLHYANLCKFIQNQWKMLLLCHFLADFDSVLFYLIGLGAGFKTVYTEFWNSLIMQIYANLFKINEKCYFVISWPILILFGLSDRACAGGFRNSYTEFWNSLIMQIYAYLFKSNKKCYFSISQRILILFVLSDRAWWGLRKFYTDIVKFINYANLCKFIQNQWKMPPLLYSEITTDLHLRRGRIYYASRNLQFTWFFSSSGPKDPMSLCHGVASVVRPSVLPSFRPSTVFKHAFFLVISQPILILILS